MSASSGVNALRTTISFDGCDHADEEERFRDQPTFAHGASNGPQQLYEDEHDEQRIQGVLDRSECPVLDLGDQAVGRVDEDDCSPTDQQECHCQVEHVLRSARVPPR
jgi:hypothetical protein